MPTEVGYIVTVVVIDDVQEHITVTGGSSGSGSNLRHNETLQRKNSNYNKVAFN